MNIIHTINKKKKEAKKKKNQDDDDIMPWVTFLNDLTGLKSCFKLCKLFLG